MFMALLNLAAWLLVIAVGLFLTTYLFMGVLALALRVFERPLRFFITLLVRLLELPFKFADRLAVKSPPTAAGVAAGDPPASV